MIFSEETKKMMSLSHTGLKHSFETREKISQGRLNCSSVACVSRGGRRCMFRFSVPSYFAPILNAHCVSSLGRNKIIQEALKDYFKKMEWVK